MQPLKLCCDCKRARRGLLGWLIRSWEFATCDVTPDEDMEYLVGGRGREFCSIARKYGPCGRTGNLWEPR